MNQYQIVLSTQHPELKKSLDTAFASYFQEPPNEFLAQFYVGEIVLLIKNNGIEFALLDEKSEQKKVDEILRLLENTNRMIGELHPVARNQFLDSLEERSLKYVELEFPNAPKPKQQDLSRMKIKPLFRAVVGSKNHPSICRPLREEFRVKAKFDRIQSRAEKRYLKAAVVDICRATWKACRGEAPPRWFNDTNSEFENFLSETFDCIDGLKGVDLKNAAKAYNEYFKEAD